MKNSYGTSALALGVLVASTIAAQEAPPPDVLIRPDDIYVPAEPVTRTAPSYPSRSLSQGREGWVVVSYVVSEQGDVIEPMIEDSSNPDFDDATLRAIETWQYKPAMRGGKPVEESMVPRIS
jgi:TonB family protein